MDSPTPIPIPSPTPSPIPVPRQFYLNSCSSFCISLILVSTAVLFCRKISSSEIDALIVLSPSDMMLDLGSRKYLRSVNEIGVGLNMEKGQ